MVIRLLAKQHLIPYVLTCASLVMSAMELALALEKLVNEKLHNLHSVSCSSMPTYSKVTVNGLCNATSQNLKCGCSKLTGSYEVQ